MASIRCAWFRTVNTRRTAVSLIEHNPDTTEKGSRMDRSFICLYALCCCGIFDACCDLGVEKEPEIQ
ncbi:hypothetical protein QYF36_007873 [Acer negundo]|nr:hypothetical protein QYF36_007873 [Acer negundo]